MRQQYMAIAVAVVLLGCAGTSAEAQSRGGGDAGKARSPASGVEDYEGAGPVIVTPEVREGWRYLYRYITEVEFVLCLEGRRSGDTIIIDGFRLARMENESSTSVRYHPCDSDRYVGTAHNHPPTGEGNSLCYRSMPDRRSFEQDLRAVVDIILCGPDQFMWVLKDGTTGGPTDDGALP